MGSVQLEHKNMSKLVLVTLIFGTDDGVEEEWGFLNLEKDPANATELSRMR